MYVIIEEVPAQEYITRFEMELTEDDTYFNYIVDLAGRSKEDKKELSEIFDFELGRLANKTTLTLTIESEMDR